LGGPTRLWHGRMVLLGNFLWRLLGRVHEHGRVRVPFSVTWVWRIDGLRVDRNAWSAYDARMIPGIVKRPKYIFGVFEITRIHHNQLSSVLILREATAEDLGNDVLIDQLGWRPPIHSVCHRRYRSEILGGILVSCLAHFVKCDLRCQRKWTAELGGEAEDTF